MGAVRGGRGGGGYHPNINSHPERETLSKVESLVNIKKERKGYKVSLTRSAPFSRTVPLQLPYLLSKFVFKKGKIYCMLRNKKIFSDVKAPLAASL